MLTARKNNLINKLLYYGIFWLPARKAFYRVHLRQSSATPVTTLPVIAYANHSSWWDANMISILNERVWNRDAYVMMEEEQLRRYQFFRFMGAFSVNRHDPRQAVRSMRYATDLLHTGHNRMLLIFPQGEIAHSDQRPLNFFTGLGHIARQAAPCAAYPIAIRYEFIGEQKPEVFISVGAPVQITQDALVVRELILSLEQRLTNELDELHSNLVERNYTGFTTILQGAMSINRLWDSLRRRRQIKQLGPDNR